MADSLKQPIENVSKAVNSKGERIEKSLKDMQVSMANASAIQAVDLLTDDEVDELRILVELGSEAGQRVAELSADDRMFGMYAQLSDSGFIHCMRILGGGLICHGVDPKASWAIARHDYTKKLEADRKALEEQHRKEDRKHQRNDLALGFLLGILTPIILSAIRSLAASFGITIG